MSAAAASVAALRAELRATLGGGADAARDADLILSAALERPRAWLIAHDRDPAAPEQAHAARALAARRRGGEPIAYLLGRREFWSLDLDVSPAVLIPRHETERLVECALHRLPPGAAARVGDLGTGSGAVALALARERPRAAVVASDESRAALAVAARNVARHAPRRVRLVCARWLSAFAAERFEVLVSNPPYVAAADPHLARGDLPHEPRDALVSGADGLDALRALAAGAPRCLVPGGWLLVEHGAQQGAAVRALFAAAGLAAVATHRDLAGRERVTEGRRAATSASLQSTP